MTAGMFLDDFSVKYNPVKRFVLNRKKDESGVSGTGIVADGVQFPCGKCVLCFRMEPHSVIVFNSISEVEQVHGHNGKTLIEW